MKNRPKALITSYFLRPGDEVDRLLQEAGMETVFNRWHGGRTEEELIDLLQGVDAAIASVDPFTAKVMDGAPQLKVISRTGVGYDAVDVPAATARGIAVCITPGTNQNAVADFAMALILACARRLRENMAEVPAGRWVLHEGHDLADSTLGIVGTGLIGREVAKRARAFGMRVLAHDICPDAAFARTNDVTYLPLEDLLSASDFVSLHCFLNDETRHLINGERLALMKPTAYVVNTSRGGVVDTGALYQALKERRIAGAALDVYEKEPPGETPLAELDNAYLTPHVAGSTVEARRNMGLMAAENVIRLVSGETPRGIVNPEALTLARPPLGSMLPGLP